MYVCQYIYTRKFAVRFQQANGSCRFPYIYIRKMELMENGSNLKRQLPLFAANRNGKRKFVSRGWQTINGNQQLLFQQTCPSMPGNMLCSYTYCGFIMAQKT